MQFHMHGCILNDKLTFLWYNGTHFEKHRIKIKLWLKIMNKILFLRKYFRESSCILNTKSFRKVFFLKKLNYFHRKLLKLIKYFFYDISKEIIS